MFSRVSCVSVFVAIVGLVLVSGCAKTVKVFKAGSEGEGDFVYYALPRTVVTVTAVVSVSTIKGKPECASRIADVGLRKPAFGPSDPNATAKFFTFSEATITTNAEADPNEIYAIALEGKGASDLAVTFNARGALTEGSSESKDVIAPIVLGATQFAASVAAKAFAGTKVPGAAAPPDHCGDAVAALIDARKRISEAYTNAGSSPKEVLELRVAKLTVLAKSLEAPFTGVTPGSPKKVVCYIRPVKDNGARIDTDLFIWKRGEGIRQDGRNSACEIAADLGTWPDSLKGTDRDVDADLAKQHTLTLRITRSAADLSKISPTTKTGDRSFYYRIPAFAQLVVGDRAGGDTWEQASDQIEAPIAQLGQSLSLPVSKSTNTAKSGVALDAETGALTRVTATTTEFDFGAALATIGTSAGSVIEARKGGKHDEDLEQLQREQAVLEARVAIKAARAALAEP